MDMNALPPGQGENKASSPATVRQEGGRGHRMFAPMKHARRLIAREGRRQAASASVFFLCAGLFWATPASAQIEMRDLNDLSHQRTLPPYLKYIPTDPHLAIRDYLRVTLPPMWWGREIDYAPGRITVEIHPPLNWRGNPTSMMLRLCPPSNHNLWRIYRQIEMRPYYEKKYWPSYTCRRI